MLFWFIFFLKKIIYKNYKNRSCLLILATISPNNHANLNQNFIELDSSINPPIRRTRFLQNPSNKNTITGGVITGIPPGMLV